MSMDEYFEYSTTDKLLTDLSNNQILDLIKNGSLALTRNMNSNNDSSFYNSTIYYKGWYSPLNTNTESRIKSLFLDYKINEIING